MRSYSLEEYRAKLERIAERFPETVRESLRKSAVMVRDEWANQWSGPVLKKRTGRLVDSLTVDVSIAPLRARVYVGNVSGKSQKYKAVAAEEGMTRNHPGGTPYFHGAGGRLVFMKRSDPRAAGLPRTAPHQIPEAKREAVKPTWQAKRESVLDLIGKELIEVFDRE